MSQLYWIGYYLVLILWFLVPTPKEKMPRIAFRCIPLAMVVLTIGAWSMESDRLKEIKTLKLQIQESVKK